MLAQINIFIFDDFNIYIFFFIIFFDFFKFEELTWNKWNFDKSSMIYISWKSIKFISNEIIIHLSKSKINQIDQDINLILFFANDISYSIQILYYLFQKYSRFNFDLLFIYFIEFFNKYWFFENIISLFFKAEILNFSKYSSHSFQCDIINITIAIDFSLDEIKTLE